MRLTELEKKRYQKHILLPEIGEEGQLKLKKATVLVVGAGGLGSPVLLYLAAAGVGRIRIVDGDVVSLDNLHRQVIHTTADCGVKKVDSALERIKALNPEVQLETTSVFINRTNIDNLVSGCYPVIDCTDNLESRFLVSSACVRQGIPYVFGAVFRYEGQVSVFDATRGPCFRCLYPEIPGEKALPDPRTNGLLGTIPGVIGVLQANEALKLILGIGEPLIGRMLLFDGLNAAFHLVRMLKHKDCPVCGEQHQPKKSPN